MAQSTRSRAPHGGEIIEASRRGAHRARPSAVLAVLPAVAVIAILAALGVLVYTMLLKPLTTSSGGSAGTALGGTASSSAGAVATGKASAGASAGTGSGAGAAAGGGASAAAGAAASPDPAVVVNFYNATTVKGLSRKAAAAAETAGWRIGAIQTWAGPAVTETTIYVATSQQQASGAALAKALGVGVVKVSASKAGKGNMSVVVGPDYPTG
jgi:LytR cell envelope-related transcriptional attenuator